MHRTGNSLFLFCFGGTYICQAMNCFLDARCGFNNAYCTVYSTHKPSPAGRAIKAFCFCVFIPHQSQKRGWWWYLAGVSAWCACPLTSTNWKSLSFLPPKSTLRPKNKKTPYNGVSMETLPQSVESRSQQRLFYDSIKEKKKRITKCKKTKK